MDSARSERLTRTFFRISVLCKGGISLLELLSGIAVLIVPPAAIAGWVIAAAQTELMEEPGNFFASYSLQLAQHYSLTSGLIIALYLVSRGMIKLGLVAALLKNQLWAYPASLIILGAFMLYQAYAFVVGHSPLIALLTILDFIVVFFIWAEYRIVRRRGV